MPFQDKGDSELTYTAKTQRPTLIFIILLSVPALYFADSPSTYYFFIPLLTFILAAIFTNFRLTIKDGYLTFEILLFNFRVYKKEVEHKQIESIKLKRIGWASKCVIVKNKRGVNFRITNFQPTEIYGDLIKYAEKYDIPTSKTKDYLILEKMN